MGLAKLYRYKWGDIVLALKMFNVHWKPNYLYKQLWFLLFFICPRFFKLENNCFYNVVAVSAVHQWESVIIIPSGVSQVVLVVKNPPANAGDIRDIGLIPELGRSPGGGHGNPLQYSCLEYPLDRGAWRATIHAVAKSRTWLNWLSTAQHSLMRASLYVTSCFTLLF